jgi:DNA-binding CsgD family transcriptional regulator
VKTVRSAGHLVGRLAELAGLAELLDESAGTAMVVLGEAGSGKSALLEVAAALAEDRGVRVLQVTGYEAESRYPYAGLHQLLIPVLDDLADTDRESGRILRDVLGLHDRLPQIASGPAPPAEADPPQPGSITASEVGEACQRLLRFVNSRRRTMIIVDDMQWLDAESARALSALCRRLQVPDVNLLIAVRGQSAPEELGVRTREYLLAPLAPGDAQDLLRRSAGTLYGDARDAVLRQAAGNPLALVELGQAVAASPPGRLGAFDDGPLPLARRLEALYSARARGLPPPTRRALLLASAAGSNELADAIASGRLTIAPEDWIPAAEAGLVALDTRRPGTPVPAFIHPLMRSAVFQSASYADQSDAHRNLAAALASRPERRAWHLAQSVWHPDEDIAGMLEAVGADAYRRCAFHAAAAALERAAELSPRPRDACRRFIRAADYASHGDQRTWMLRLAQRALTAGREAGLGDAELGEAQRFIARGKVYLGADASLVPDLIATVRTSSPETAFHTAAIAGLAATAAYYAPVPGQLAELRTILDRLTDPVAQPEAWDEPKSAGAMLTYARYAVSPFLPRPDPLPDRGIFDLAEVEYDQPQGLSMFGAVAYLLDQPELAARAMALVFAERSATHQKNPTDPTLFNAIASNNEMWGRWDEAVDQADDVIELATERGERFNLAFGHITAGILAVRQGRTEQARRHARAADQAADGVSRSVPTRTRHLYGLISLTEGDYQTAYTLLRAVLLTDERTPAHFHLSHYAVADFALAGLQTGQQDDAALVLDGILAHADAMTPGRTCLSRRLRLLHGLARALIADPADATALFREVLAPGAERWPFDQACAQLHFGEHLRRRRRIAEARPLLAAALETFRELGAAPWSQRAETELRAAGTAPDPHPRPTANYPESAAFATLTPQQRAVAKLAAEGLTNPQIGARLSISPKTVGIHLSQIFERLELTSRGQLRGLGHGDMAPPVE